MASVPQSQIQNLLQQNTGLQSLAQQNVPGAANNGNPNTVYNTPWGQSFQTTPPPPMTTALGEWYIPQVANPTPWQAPAGSTVAGNPIMWPTPNFVVPQQWGPKPPLQTGGPNPPVKTGGGGGGGSVINDGPGGSNGLENPLDPRNSGNYTPGQPGWRSLLEGNGIAVGEPGSSEWNRATQWTNAILSRLGGMREQNGKWDWKQVIDMVTEPLLGGNLWLSGSNKWDASNGIAAVVQAFTGIPLNNIMNKLGEWQATQSDPANTWLEKMLADHWEDNANNEVKVFQDVLNRYLTDWSAHTVGNINQQNSNANINWLNAYTDALTNAMLDGLSGQAARDAAKKAADATGRNTADPNGGGGTGSGGGGGGGYDGNLGYGVTAYEGGCVVEDNYIDGYERADEVKVNDLMNVVEFETRTEKKANVSQSEKILRPCVRIETKLGVVLECSIDAEIADEKGNRVLAEDLLGVAVPSKIYGVWFDDIVMKVTPIGERYVQKITAENNWYLAGKQKDKYLMHHNVKFYNNFGNRTTSSGWQGSGSITPNGLMWGW